MEPYRVALIQQQTRVIVEPKQRNRIVDERSSTGWCAKEAW